MGIYFDGMLYHASRKRGVVKQKLEEYLAEKNMKYSFTATRRLMQKSSGNEQSGI